MGRLLPRSALVVVLAVSVFGVDAIVSSAAASAHGIGGRADLPLPLSYTVVGAGVVLVLSFLALSILWREPRLQHPKPGREYRSGWIRVAARVLAVIGVAGLVLVVADGVIDGNHSTLHIGPVVVWVVLWLVVPFSAAVVGDAWRWLSPWRTIGGALEPANTRQVPAWLGVWPALVAFVAFTWLELVSPSSAEPVTLAIAALVYSLYLVLLARRFGTSNALAGFDLFENYVGAFARISPLEWTTADGAPTIRGRGWLRGLPSMPQRAGTTAFVVAMIGTVTYDGLSGTRWWTDTFSTVARETWFGTIALVACVAVIGAGYWLAAWVAARIVATEPGEAAAGASDIAASFAHTLVPIALAYAFAHYFTLVLFEGQLVFHAASDPFGLGWNLFGTATWRVQFFLDPNVVWWIQVAAILLGHIAGVVLAHDRALAAFGDVGVRTQYAMLVLMVLLTSLGLFILAG